MHKTRQKTDIHAEQCSDDQLIRYSSVTHSEMHRHTHTHRTSLSNQLLWFPLDVHIYWVHLSVSFSQRNAAVSRTAGTETNPQSATFPLLPWELHLLCVRVCVFVRVYLNGSTLWGPVWIWDHWREGILTGPHFLTPSKGPNTQARSVRPWQASLQLLPTWYMGTDKHTTVRHSNSSQWREAKFSLAFCLKAPLKEHLRPFLFHTRRELTLCTFPVTLFSLWQKMHFYIFHSELSISHDEQLQSLSKS